MVDKPASPENRRGRPGYDQGAVLAIAVAAFNEHGYEATSMGLLAERLEISKSAIYHHFESKDRILQHALAEALDGLEEVLLVLPADGSAIERLEAVMRGAVHVLADRLPYVTLLLRLRGNTEVERAALARRRAFDRRVSELVAAARDDGAFRDDVDVRMAERLIFGMINSIVEWYRPDGRVRPDRLADTVVAVALDGLRRR